MTKPDDILRAERAAVREFLLSHKIVLAERLPKNIGAKGARKAITRYSNAHKLDDNEHERLAKLLEECLHDAYKAVRGAVGEKAEAIFKDLTLMNEILVAADKPPQKSITAARKQFEHVFINIFDAVEGRYIDRGSSAALRKYSVTHKRVFPREDAKELGARYLLKHLF